MPQHADAQTPLSGNIPYAVGQAAAVRIPIPGQTGLCIEFSPRGHVPPGGSTSTLFFQDTRGKRHLRLDYGANPRTQTIDYHWNQTGVARNFGITNHQPVGRSGRIAYHAARYFPYGGRLLLVAGVAIDAVSIVVASRPLRRASEVVTAWAGAWAGCKIIGGVGAVGGSFASPLGTAIGGVGGCIIGGIGGYAAGERIGGYVYDWAEGTVFTPLPSVASPE